MILLLGTLFAHRHSPLKAVLYLFFIISIGFAVFPLYRFVDSQGLAKPILLTITMLFIILTLTSVIFPEHLTGSIGNYLFAILAGLVIFRLCLLLFNSKSVTVWRYSAYVGIVLFSMFVIYDTKIISMRANKCDVPYDHINNALNLFLDFVNMFSDAMMISQTSR